MEHVSLLVNMLPGIELPEKDTVVEVFGVGVIIFGGEGYDIAVLVNEFGEVLLRIVREYKPSVVSRSLFDLASAFNGFYDRHRVVREDGSLSGSRAHIVAAVKWALAAKIGIKEVGEI